MLVEMPPRDYDTIRAPAKREECNDVPWMREGMGNGSEGDRHGLGSQRHRTIGRGGC